MCGIFGYIGARNSIKTVISGLKKLEYRGYDSAGLAGVKNGQLFYAKEVGKISVLEAILEGFEVEAAIGHTRWATHGKPTRINAHPHLDAQSSLAVVHNGIIENYELLRNSLKKEGVPFISETDTEVIANLIASFYSGDLLKAVQKAVALLEGSYAIALVHRNHPDEIIVVAHQAPLAIGIGQNEAFVSSDPHAFLNFTREVIYLANAEIAVIKADKLEVYSAMQERIDKKSELLSFSTEDASKGNFEHFTLKEIYQQPQTIRSALLSRFLEEYGIASFENVNFDENELLSTERILILACGTSLHAGHIGAYMLEDKARLPTQVEIASEFRYKNPIVTVGTLVIAISQSGETADTIAAVREVQAKGAKVLAICNVQGSTLAREANQSIFLRAGPEVGVCSTKAFTSQVVVLGLFTLLMARMRHMDKQEGQLWIQALKDLPEQVQQVLNNAPAIEKIAKKYAHYENFFFFGRRYMYPTSLEGALKLKEISYINANGYPAGEMKHGPIALINEQSPVVALCCNKKTYDKMRSNLMEVKSRGAPLIAIAEEGLDQLSEIADDIIQMPVVIDELASIPTAVATQLLAYYIARERGAEIDHPRNLAKSVTVE